MGIDGIEKLTEDDDLAPDANEPGDDAPDEIKELEETETPNADHVDGVLQ